MINATVFDSWRLAARSHFFPSKQNDYCSFLKLPLARLRYHDSKGNGPVLVIAPDPPNTIEHYTSLIETLSARFRVICFDLPGFGLSYPRSGFRFTPRQQEELLIGLLDALEVESATLSFSCLASFIALGVAHRFPDRVDRLVLSQSPGLDDALSWAERMDPKHRLRQSVVGQVIMATMKKSIARGWYKAALPKGSDTSKYNAPAQRILRQGGCYCLASGLQGFENNADKMREDLKNLEQDTIVLWGAADRTHRPSDPEAIKAHIPGAEVHIFQGCGHFPDLERSDAFIKLVFA